MCKKKKKKRGRSSDSLRKDLISMITWCWCADSSTAGNSPQQVQTGSHSCGQGHSALWAAATAEATRITRGRRMTGRLHWRPLLSNLRHLLRQAERTHLITSFSSSSRLQGHSGKVNLLTVPQWDRQDVPAPQKITTKSINATKTPRKCWRWKFLTIFTPSGWKLGNVDE